MIAILNGISSFSITTPKGSYVYNPRLHSGVINIPSTIGWRLNKNKVLVQTTANSKMTPEGSNLNNPRLQSGEKMTNHSLTPPQPTH